MKGGKDPKEEKCLEDYLGKWRLLLEVQAVAVWQHLNCLRAREQKSASLIYRRVTVLT